MDWPVASRSRPFRPARSNTASPPAGSDYVHHEPSESPLQRFATFARRLLEESLFWGVRVSISVVWSFSDDELGSLAMWWRTEFGPPRMHSDAVVRVPGASPAAAHPPQAYAVAQVPFSRVSPRLRSRLRLIPAARVAHHALFLITPR